MQCTQHHPWENAIGVCAFCLRERLTDVLQLQANRPGVPFSAPLPSSSPLSQTTEADQKPSPAQEKENNGGNFTDKENNEGKKAVRGKFPFSSRFKQEQGQGQGRSKPEKMHGHGEVGGSNPEREKKENLKKSSGWMSALLPRKHRKKSSMPIPVPAADQSSKNPSFLSATSSLDNRIAYDADFAASSSNTARVNIFSESEDDEGGKLQFSPEVNPQRHGNSNSYFSGVFRSPTPTKAKGWGGSKTNQPDCCAGSFSPYTDRKFQGSKAFSMAPREDSGFAFCLSPRRLFFSHEISSRSPRHGGKFSNFFFSPSRRTS